MAYQSRWHNARSSNLDIKDLSPEAFTIPVTILCEDYGAYGTLKVSFGSDSATIKIPKDSDNNNNIADAWETTDNGWTTGMRPNSDTERQTQGNTWEGDGFTAFEEYRGFKVKGVHRRLNLARKDVFVYSEYDPTNGPSNLPIYVGYATDSSGEPINNFPSIFKVHFIRSGEMDSDNVVNHNRCIRQNGDQYWVMDMQAIIMRRSKTSNALGATVPSVYFFWYHTHTDGVRHIHGGVLHEVDGTNVGSMADAEVYEGTIRFLAGQQLPNGSQTDINNLVQEEVNVTAAHEFAHHLGLADHDLTHIRREDPDNPGTPLTQNGVDIYEYTGQGIMFYERDLGTAGTTFRTDTFRARAGIEQRENGQWSRDVYCFFAGPRERLEPPNQTARTRHHNEPICQHTPHWTARDRTSSQDINSKDMTTAPVQNSLSRSVYELNSNSPNNDGTSTAPGTTTQTSTNSEQTTDSNTDTNSDASTTTTRPCGHLTTATGNHDYITTCTTTNSRGQTCTNSTGYYACTPHTHTYPAPPPVVRCGNSWTGEGACIYNRVVSSSSTEHQETCSTHGTYWGCNQTASNWHGTRTCTRCNLSYQKCTNHATACQNLRWHTEDSDPYITGPCGHSYRRSRTTEHEYITCAVSNSRGQTCTGGSYYECLSHTHTYPPPITIQPLPCGHMPSVSGNHHWVSTCAATNSNGQTCNNNTGYYVCTPHNHTYPAAPQPDVLCGNDATGWTACTYDRVISGNDPNEHQHNCSVHGTYWGCNPWAEALHQIRTCTRCDQSFRICSNSATDCQNSYLHTTTADPLMSSPCGHEHRRSEASNHAFISSCTTTSSHGFSCTKSSSGYYICTPHTHTYTDVNGDGVVNIQDLTLVTSAFGETEPDLNGDGTVNILDLVIVSRAISE